MADIDSAIIFSETAKSEINSLCSRIDYTHRNWSDDTIMDVRKEIRNFYRIKQHGRCSYCKQQVSLTSALNCHIEHIVPKSLHPQYTFTPKNLCVICADCNEIKRSQETLGMIPETLCNDSIKKYPTISAAFKIVHPHFDKYDDHILIVNGCYIDKGSKKGNFTIGACNLNRKLAVFGWDSAIVNDDELAILMNEFISENDALERKRKLSELKLRLF